MDPNEVIIEPNKQLMQETAKEFAAAVEADPSVQQSYEHLLELLQAQPIFIGTPKERSILDIWTNTSIELP